MNIYRVIITYTRYQFIKYIQKQKSYLVEKYPDFLRMEISEELMNETYQYAYALLKESIKKGNVLRYEKLTRNRTSLTDFAFRIAWLQYIYPEVFEIIDCGFGNPLNLEIVAKMYYESDDCLDFDRKEVITAYQELQWMFSFEYVENGNFIRSSFDMDERLYQYLIEEDSENTEYEGYTVLLPKDNLENELFIKEELAENICKDIAARKHDHQTLLYQLAEEDFYCAKNVILQVQKERERGIVFLDYQKLGAMDKTRQQYICWKVLRECRLWDLDICITNLESKKENEISAFLKEFMMSNLNCWSVCYFTTDPLTELAVYIDRVIMRFRMKFPTREERMVLWEKYCGKQKLIQNLRYDIISTKFKLSSEQIKKGVTYLKYLEDGGEKINEKTISRVCTQLLPPPSQGTIKQVDVEYTLDDLKLPIRQKQILKNVCSHVWNRHQVFDIWDMEKKYPYGKGISVLFAGPPGTGKTMAAQVISSMLELPLYKIDLSQVVDKYIGETEKRLEEIFTLAEKSNTILFFDEADSIFGKRSEVNDSKDKYANTEVSYILQRIEQYDGIVILATNYRSNIDEAFMRRIRYVVEFQMPDAATRLELWKSCFSEKTPKDQVDFEFLAEEFEVSGGNIKNIVLNAAFMAAEQQREIEMIDILESLRIERLKSGKVMIPKDFGKYQVLFE